MQKPHCLSDDIFPECPERIMTIQTACSDQGLIDRCERIQVGLHLFFVSLYYLSPSIISYRVFYGLS